MKAPLPVRTLPSLAFQAWLTPPPLPETARRRDIEVLGGFDHTYFGGVHGYEIGEGPLVVAMHGWGGRAAQWGPMARHLADKGYRVLVPQLPGHAGGPRTNIKEAAAVIRQLLDEVGWPETVLAHSFAAMVARLAFAIEAPDRVVMVAPALNVEDALDVFSDRLDLASWASRGLRSRLRNWDPELWPVVSALRPEQLPGARVLIVHDPDDVETPFARSAELAAIRRDTSIVPVPGAGHSRILSADATLRSVLDFVVDRSEVGHDAA